VRWRTLLSRTPGGADRQGVGATACKNDASPTSGCNAC